MAPGKVTNVAIVGAGIAGLRCSDVLAHHGLKVTLFEARNRIGGRVHQVESGGYLMDMGPNWIHGTKGNPIMDLAEKTATAILEPEEEQALYDTKGIRRPDSEAVELSGKIWEMVVGAFKYSDEHSAAIDPQVSLFEYFQARLAEEGVDPQKRDDLLQEAQMWGPFVGDSVEKQSLKFFFLEECVEGENVIVASTYKDILKEIGRPVVEEGSKVDLRLETEIVHIDIGEDVGRNITLTTASGEKATFDDVVVTCPLGWLKRHHVKSFTPSLPPLLVDAIDHINYGRLEKLYVTFPSAFWLSQGDDSGSGSFSTNTSTNSEMSNHSSFPLFTHFHDPNYIPHPADEAWNQSLVSLAHLSPPNAHPTLLFYIYGACATHVVDLIKDLPAHSAAYNSALDAFARPFYSLLPGFSPSRACCKPTAFLATTWQADAHAGNGSYCNFQVGLEHGDRDIEVLRDAGGWTSKGLWLAGEHTAPFVALGTTTGAWWSGEGVARRICAAHGIPVLLDDGVPLDEEGKKKELDEKAPDAANLAGLAI